MRNWRLPEISIHWETYYSTLKRLPKRLKTPASFLIEELPAFRRRRVKNVLDLGCGAGRGCIYMAKNGFDSVGVDVSRSALKLASKWVRKEKLANVALVCATMSNLPFGDECFDAVISISVLHHAQKKDIKKTVAEAHRILRKNGLFLANIASVKDPRYGEGEEVEKNTFRIWEAFAERRFEELHHFSTEQETYEMLACFAETNVELLKDKPNYWKIMARK